MTARPRVAVIGVGTMGSQAMWRLAARGADVIGYDRYAPGHDRGAAGGESRIYRAAHLGEPAYRPVLALADRLWEELQRETGRQLRRRSGALIMGESDSSPIRTLLETSEAHGLDHEVLDPRAMAARYPMHRMPEGHIAVLDRDGGIIRPEASVLSAARRAEQLGATLRRYCTVHELRPVAGGGVDVIGDHGADRVDRVVVTAGPWVNLLLPDLPRPVEVRRLISSWHLPTTHDWFAHGAPPFVRSAPRDCYGLPSPDGLTVKIGLSRPEHRLVSDPERLDREVHPEELETFRTLIADLMPDLHPDPVRLNVYMEGYTETSNPLVGPLPGAEDILVLAGFSGSGFKMSPGFGEIAADLALDGKTEHPIGFLAPRPTV